MMYNKEAVPQINESFSSASALKGRVISVVDGEFKLIETSPKLLDNVLSYIDGKKTFAEIEECLLDKYPLDGIQNYLMVLLQENIISVIKNIESDAEKKRILVIGNGRMADSMMRAAKKRELYVECVTVEEFFKVVQTTDFDAIVFAPEVATFDELLRVNHLIIELKKCYYPFYFNGKYAVVGPAIIAGRTACGECQVIHHLNAVNDKLSQRSQFAIDDIRYLNAAFQLPESYTEAQCDYWADMIIKDIFRLVDSQENLDFLESEKRFLPGETAPALESSYYPTTTCSCCHGMNQNYFKWADGISRPQRTQETSDDTTICYTVGGLRSRTEEETTRLIRDAVDRAGLDIIVKRMVGSPFDKVIPIFRAVLSASQNNNTPYFFRNATTHGKGMTERQSFLSASFEMVEHISANYFGDIPLVSGSFNEVRDVAIDMLPLAESIRNTHTAFDQFTTDMPIDWVWAKSLVDGDYKLVPASLVFMGDVKLKGQFFGANSSGLAAGSTLDDAILQAMFEVIEHDAWMMGQANQMPLPFLDYETSSNAKLKEYINSVKGLGYKVICRDYTNDLGFAVFRTWIVNPNDYTHYASSGFGASLSPEIALERSFTEAIQSADVMIDATRTYFGRATARQLISSADSFYSLAYFQKKDILGNADSNSMKDKLEMPINSVRDAIKYTVATLQEKIPGCDVLYVDLTRDVLNIPAVRVIITGDIQHLNVPVISVSPRTFRFGPMMGYSSEETTYEDLYLGPYPH